MGSVWPMQDADDDGGGYDGGGGGGVFARRQMHRCISIRVFFGCACPYPCNFTKQLQQRPNTYMCMYMYASA